MANLTSHQVAQLLIGIARAQQAIIEAVESSKPGFRATHLAPALINAARVRDTHRPLQLSDLPARVLMQCMGRNGPNVDQVARDLDELLARGGTGSSGDDNTLDMTKL